MTKARNTTVTKLVVIATLVLFMIAQHPGVLSSAEAAKATVTIKHKPLKHFIAGHRIQIEAKVTDSQGITLVRCYFRAAGQDDFVFVGMKAGEKDVFTGILPSPAAETKGIEYLFLTVNGKNQVVKTQTFRTANKAATQVPDWQKVSGDGHVALSTELPQATVPQGFSDSISTDVVESSVRFGYVAGIYSTAQITGGVTAAGSSTGAAAAATSGGTVSVSSGLPTMGIVGASAAAIVVAAGTAVATGGGGDGGSDKYAGNWAGQFESGYRFTMTVNNDGSFTFCSWTCLNGQVDGNRLAGNGRYSDESWSVEGRFTSSTSVSGTYLASLNGGLVKNWSGTKR